MRYIQIILILLMLPLSMKSQNATATIESVGSCTGDSLLVPVNVTDFNDVGAMTIFIGYDTNSAEFISLANINPVIPGAMTVNAYDGQVAIAYSFIDGFTITNGKLFDLNYLHLDSSTQLVFNPGTEIANTNLEIIPLDTINGGIYNAITILAQPDSVQAYPDTDVIFSVLATGNNIAYQWEENSGSGWLSLQNNTTYSGAETDSLTIHDVPLSYDGFTYRCLLTSGNCSQYTDIALLEVNTAFPAATIGQVHSCPEQIILQPLFAGDLYDIVEFTFNIGFDENVMVFISIKNIHPDLQNGNLNTSPISNPNGISVHWEDNDPVSITSGKLFDMEFTYYQSNTTVEFLTGSEVINSQSNTINITLSNGSVSQYELPEILSQPESQTILVNDLAIFTIEATGVESYQWQVSTDSGENWADLENVIPYYNVTTEELTINPVTWDLNNYQYACLLTGAYCQVRSDAAVLSVDTLTWTGREPDHATDQLKILPNPTRDIARLVFTSGCSCDAVITIFTLTGEKIHHFPEKGVSEGKNVLTLDLQSIDPGLYLVEIMLKGVSTTTLQRSKLVKVLE